MKPARAGHCPQCGGKKLSEAIRKSPPNTISLTKGLMCLHCSYVFLTPSPAAIAIENWPRALELLKRNAFPNMVQKLGGPCRIVESARNQDIKDTKAFLAEIGKLEPELKESCIKEINESIEELDDPSKCKTFDTVDELMDDLHKDTPPDEK